MAERSNSSPPGGPALQTVLTLTAGNSDQLRRTFVWGPPVDPFGVGTRGLWYVHGPGVQHVHLYLAFDGRQVQVAAAEGASVTLHGAEVGQLWRPVPVNSELHFASATISVTCEEAPAAASGSAPPEGTGVVPRTLIVDRTVAMDEVLAGENGPLEPALPRTGTLRLMERAWAPPTPQPQTPPPPPPAASPVLSKNTQPAGGSAPPPAAMPPPEPALDPRITRPPTPIAPQAPITPPRALTAQHPITRPPTPIPPQAPVTPPRAVTAQSPITKPPTPIAPRAPITPPPAVPHSPPIAPIAPRAPVAPPNALTPPRPIIPDIPLRGPLRPPEGPMDQVPLMAPQSEAVPTMADGGALREHARRLDGVAPDAADPVAREYFSAVRVYSGKAPSEPPPAQPENMAPARQASEKVPSNPPPPDAVPAPRVVEKAPAEKKQKPRFGQSWKETSLVKKAILFLLPLAAAGTLLDLQRESESEEAEAPHPPATTSAAAAAKAVPATPSAGTLASAAPSEQASAVADTVAEKPAPSASAAPESTALIPLSSVTAPASAAPGGSNEPMITMVPSTPGAASAVAANSAVPAAPGVPSTTPPSSSAGAAPLASTAPAGSAVAANDETDQERAVHLFEHLALNAVFAGNLPQATTLYEKLAAGSPDSRIYSLAVRLTKAGAVRTP
jgi:hypothetical protein